MYSERVQEIKATNVQLRTFAKQIEVKKKKTERAHLPFLTHMLHAYSVGVTHLCTVISQLLC